ncbi:MAG TPA: hypothetical protein VMG10_06145, partial [Gemmataceae bacterium]|nr:hypothetical protein [Gemmataceae bacterium]
MNKPVYRSTLIVNTSKQLLNCGRIGQIVLFTREDDLLAEVAQVLCESSGDSRAVIGQNEGAAREDGADIREGRSIHSSDEHALNTSPISILWRAGLR